MERGTRDPKPAPAARDMLVWLRGGLLAVTLAVAGLLAARGSLWPAVRRLAAGAWSALLGAWGRWPRTAEPLDWLLLGLSAVLALYVLAVLVSELVFVADIAVDLVRGRGRRERRHLVVCIDGTWNHPGQTSDGRGAPTNVVRFWEALQEPRAPEAGARAGRTAAPGPAAPDEQGRIPARPGPKGAGGLRRVLFTSAQGLGDRRLGATSVSRSASSSASSGAPSAADDMRLVTLYYAGLGNAAEHTLVGRVLGGAFGWGVHGLTSRILRDLTRWRTADTHVTIVGFSRGAAIARLLTRDLGLYGIPSWRLCGLLPLQAARRVLLWLFARRGRVRWLGAEARVEFVGLWDTVASFGLAKNVLGIPFQRLNLGMDFDVRHHARRVVHLVSIDDERDAFQPTLLGLKAQDVLASSSGGSSSGGPAADGTAAGDAASGDTAPASARLTETWVAGVHSDVGGGRVDAALASIALELMIVHACRWASERGAAYQLAFPGAAADLGQVTAEGLGPRSLAERWAAWARSGSVGTHEENTLFEREPRTLPIPAAVHWTVAERLKALGAAYAPAALLDLERRAALRARLPSGTEVGALQVLDRTGRSEG